MTHALFGLESDTCVECSHAHADSIARTEQEFAHFYARFQPRLLRYARRVWGARDAEEITQETLVRAYEAIDLNRDERSLWGWLVVVGRNVAADLARARRMCDVGGETTAHDSTADPKCVEQSVLDSECLSTLGMALSALPPSQSRAWWLSVAEGMTPSSIAESLACSPEAVRQALFKSRKRLAAAMADFCDRTAAFAVPAVLLFRRGSSRVGRSMAPAAANGFLGAALVSTTALTATVFGGGSAPAPAVGAHQLTVVVAADTRDVIRTPHAVVRAPMAVGMPRSAQARRTASAPAPAAPVVADTRLSKHPLGRGETAHEHVYIDAPFGLGRYGIDEGQYSNGDSVLCGHTDVVKCD
ncbi:MAG: polymerase sigma-70 factor, subfamily [Frankiaceae bacterium]|jgi:RNA polymerase sigma-70 factor (ECF subfamily)|nr:polymerase sigma-70 factor, subfamily [Frankiaceae bacterium]